MGKIYNYDAFGNVVSGEEYSPFDSVNSDGSQLAAQSAVHIAADLATHLANETS